MDRHTVNWKGYMPAISTPFHEDGTVDWDGWKSLLTWLVDEGMHGLVINGTTGEWFSQTTEEMEELFRVAAEVVNGDIPIIAGCTAYTPEQVVRHAGLAEKAKLDGILVAPPPYIVPTNEELVAYYQYINDHVPLPICVYNSFGLTSTGFSTRLRQSPSICTYQSAGRIPAFVFLYPAGTFPCRICSIISLISSFMFPP